MFWTDANGMELVKRTRYRRNGFAASQLEEGIANPIGGNYYPVTSSISIADDAGTQLIVVTDRGQGEGSSVILPDASFRIFGVVVQTRTVC